MTDDFVNWVRENPETGAALIVLFFILWLLSD